MKICTCIGTRPQYIKASALSKELRKKHKEILINTGQHYSFDLSNIFFGELGIPKPDYELNIGSDTQGSQTGRMLIEIEKVLVKEKPDVVLVYGDCNTTLAGALAAVKLHIPLVHIESGCRSFDKRMSEEYNRIVTDHVADILFCTTQSNARQLQKEGITKNVYVVGDVMYDAMLQNKDSAEINSDVLHRLHLKPEEYVLVTCHRAENTDDKETLTAIVEGLVESGEKIVFPLHPRTEKMMRQFKIYSKLSRSKKIIVTEPLGYWDFQKLERNAKKIVTDSGGVVKEAYYFKKPCITMRQCSEWIETQQDGWNTCVNIISKTSLAKAIKTFRPTKPQTEVFGNGTASKVIVEILDEIFAKRGSR